MTIARRTFMGGLSATGLILSGCVSRPVPGRADLHTPSSYATEAERGLEEIFIWPDGPPGTAPTNVKPDQPYHVAAPSMFAYVPEVPNGAAILLCQGGGYRAVGRSADVPLYWQSHGYTVFDLRYRLPYAGWSAGPDVTLQDAHQAMRTIRSEAARFGLDPRNIGVMGYSSGGHMATYLGTAFERDLAPEASSLSGVSARPAFVCAGCPVVTLSGPFAHGGSVESMFGRERDPSELDARSPEKLVTAETPPMFLVHAANDRVVPPENSILLYRALRAAGVDAEMHIFREGGHSLGAGYRPGSPLTTYPDLMRAFIERRLT